MFRLFLATKVCRNNAVVTIPVKPRWISVAASDQGNSRSHITRTFISILKILSKRRDISRKPLLQACKKSAISRLLFSNPSVKTLSCRSRYRGVRNSNKRIPNNKRPLLQGVLLDGNAQSLYRYTGIIIYIFVCVCSIYTELTVGVFW